MIRNGMSHEEAGRIGWEKTHQMVTATRRANASAVRIAYETLDKRCLECNKPIPFEKNKNKYCGHPCAATGVNRTRVPMLKGTCRSCGCRISSSNTECTPCWYQRRQADINKEPGSSTMMLDQAKTDETRKRILIYECGRTCSVCSLSEWRGQTIPIELDHIDGDCFNNDRSNLRLLCPNCHAQTPTYRGKNKGKGRRPKENNWRPSRGKVPKTQSPNSELN